jgi:hypothetical protein
MLLLHFFWLGLVFALSGFINYSISIKITPMQSEKHKVTNPRGTQDAANDNAESRAKTSGAGANIADEDIEPVLDEEDMKENHLKEEDLDKIVWDKPEKTDEDLSKTEKDITD